MTQNPSASTDDNPSTDGALALRAMSRAGDAIVTVDQHGVITSWNVAAAALLGHSADEAVGQTLALIVPPQFRGAHMAAFNAAMASGHLQGGGRPARVEVVTSEGRPLVLAMSLGTLTNADSATVVGAVAVLRAAELGLLPFVGD